MIGLPKLYFKKVHKTTGAEFIDYFTHKNIMGYDLFKLCDIPSRAEARIDYWNDMLGSEWVYSIVGWEHDTKPKPCSKCHGVGYYDEGHENDDGSMGGGNYVECDKCNPKLIGWATKAQLKNGVFLFGPQRGSECIGLLPVYTKDQL